MRIQKDKAMHFADGFLIALIGYIFTGEFKVGVGWAFMAGIFKETVDSQTHDPDFMDMVATAAGGGLGGMSGYLVDKMRKEKDRGH